jgi:hypothetical protein
VALLKNYEVRKSVKRNVQEIDVKTQASVADSQSRETWLELPSQCNITGLVPVFFSDFLYICSKID